MELELIVARHKEDLSWLRRVPFDFSLSVYDKSGQDGETPLPPLRPARRSTSRSTEGTAGQSTGQDVNGRRVEMWALANEGREAHTYLHHVVSRWHSLAEISVFCQGRPFDHAWDFHAFLRALALEPASLGAWRWVGHTVDTDTCDGALFRDWSKNIGGGGLDLGGFHRALLGGDGPDEYIFVLGGQFAARREAVHARGLEFWELALSLSLSWPDGAHCFERTWDKALDQPGPAPNWMAGRRTVHLKKMRE